MVKFSRSAHVTLSRMCTAHVTLSRGIPARVAELVDALVLGTSVLGRESSSLSPSTKLKTPQYGQEN
jgi:hypothetical protein